MLAGTRHRNFPGIVFANLNRAGAVASGSAITTGAAASTIGASLSSITLDGRPPGTIVLARYNRIATALALPFFAIAFVIHANRSIAGAGLEILPKSADTSLH